MSDPDWPQEGERLYDVDGTPRPASEIVEQYAGLVDHILRTKYGHFRGLPHVGREDLHQVGMLGLFRAVQGYRPTGASFATYARVLIAGAIGDLIRGEQPSTRHTREQYGEIMAAKDRLRARLIREPSKEEVAQELGVDIARISEIELRIRRSDLVSYDDPSYHHERDRARADLPVEGVGDRRAIVESAIDEIADDEVRLILTLFHLDKMKMRDIVDYLEISATKASGLRMRGESQLRRILRDRGLLEETAD